MKNWLRNNRGFLVFLLVFGLFRTAVADWNPIPSASMTSAPEAPASWAVMLASPTARRAWERSRRMSASSPTRRMLRLRRAVTP